MNEESVGQEAPDVKPKRRALSKKTRFEVFKRDGFKCQYCGAHPPGVLLHVDHIVAVAEGGSNSDSNLVTACEPCNLGKGARSLQVAPQSLSEKARLVAEREEQLRGYYGVMEAQRDRVEKDLWRVAEIVCPGSYELGLPRDWAASILRFNERLGLYEVLRAADIARGRHVYGGKRTFLYFCGICWNAIRQEEAFQ